MGVAVPLSVPVVPGMWHQSAEKGRHVAGHIRIGTLIDGQATGRMRAVDRKRTTGAFRQAGPHMCSDSVCNIKKFLSTFSHDAYAFHTLSR